MNVENGMRRAGFGCGGALAFAALTVVITLGGVAVHQWIDATYAGHGAGQGEGLIAGIVLLASPVVGLAAAWRPVAGVVIGGLLLAALLALHVAAIVM